jgi:DNA-binding SARP family transcriptional activator
MADERTNLPVLGGRIERPRLISALRARFERRVTIVGGGAGFGKTTVLALAIENNLLDPFGTDHWIPAGAQDRDPLVFANSLARLLGLEASTDWHSVLDAIAEAIWARTPDEIALVIDDAHLVTATRDGRKALRHLIDILPRNGHVVLGTREPSALPVARLEAAGDVLRLDETDLVFDDNELDQLRVAVPADATGPVPNALPAWPALAALQLRSGSGSEFDYIWEEILHELPEERVRHLRSIAALPVFDDTLVCAVTDGEITSAQELVTGLSGVTWTGGQGRLHALVREAILARTPPENRATAARRAGQVERERGRLPQAAELFAMAGAHEELIETAVELAFMPIVMAVIEEFAVVHATLLETVRDHPIIDYFATTLMWEHDDAEAGRKFNLVAARAREFGAPEVETIALWRAIQSLRLDVRDVTIAAYRRMFELAETQPFAAGATALLKSYEAQFAGDSEGSIRHIEDLSGMGELNAILNHAQRCGDLGRPELVRGDTGPPGLTAFFHAQAIWQRGEVSPEDALLLALSTLDKTRRQGVANTTISLLGVLSIVAFAAGDIDSARAFADEASRLSGRSAGASVEAFGLLAHAAIATLESDDRAAAYIEEAFSDLPPEPFPDRAHLYVLPLLYVVDPTRREFLESLDVGPAHTAAIAAGRALVSLRAGDGAATERLVWDRPNLLRAHVQVPHLMELCVAASARRVAGAEELLGLLPYREQLWPRLVDHPDSMVAERAAREVRDFIPRPEHPLRIRTLGAFEVDLGPGRPVATDWVRRERVRRLLAELVEHRRLTRDQVKAALWPDLDDRKGDSNLRVNLSHLLRVLEPDRGPRTPPYYVRTNGEFIELADDVWIDVDEFTAAMRHAQEMDDSGAPAAAIEAYESCLELFAGNYLQEFEVDDLGTTQRLRVRSLAVGAMCRIGELRLAKGEPTRAGGWAAEAIRLDPLSERAARLQIRTFLGSDDRSAAAAAASDLVGRLAEAGLPMDADTRRLIDPLGVTATRSGRRS